MVRLCSGMPYAHLVFCMDTFSFVTVVGMENGVVSGCYFFGGIWFPDTLRSKRPFLFLWSPLMSARVIEVIPLSPQRFICL